jgi:predicted DNA-binding transcriptional regulator AlpA
MHARMNTDNVNAEVMMIEKETQPGWLHGREALARWCGLAPRTISRLMAEGKLPHRRLSKRCVIFRIADVDRALSQLGE